MFDIINHKLFKMKKIFLIATLIFSKFIYSQNTERLSVHFFDVPNELAEEFKAFHSEINLLLENNGFGKDFYRIYRAKGDDLKSFKYFRISNYTSDKHYKMTHDLGDEAKEITKRYREMRKKVFTMEDETHLYRKVFNLLIINSKIILTKVGFFYAIISCIES